VKKFQPMILAAVLASGALAVPPVVRWDAETSRPAPQDCDVWQGETVVLEPRIVSYGQAVAIGPTNLVTFYWQTNGMGAAWWSAAGTNTATAGRVRAIWRPAYDVGASAYAWHVAVESPEGAAYRAYGRFRMRTSPGAAVAVLPAPERVLDWGAIVWTNAPWALTADLDAEALIRASADATNAAAISAEAAARTAAIRATSIVDRAYAAQQAAAHAGSTGAVVRAWASAEIAASSGVDRAWAQAYMDGATNGLPFSAYLPLGGGRVDGDLQVTGGLDFSGAQAGAIGNDGGPVAFCWWDSGAGAPQGLEGAEVYTSHADSEGVVMAPYTPIFGAHADSGGTAQATKAHADSGGQALGANSHASVGGAALGSDTFAVAGQADAAQSMAFGQFARVTNTTHAGSVVVATDAVANDMWYYSHGPATFEVNPRGGASGFWIGQETLGGIIAATSGVDRAWSDARFLSSTPGWFWQGSQVVATNVWIATTNGRAFYQPGYGRYDLVPHTTTRHDVTGSVTVISSRYIVGVAADWHQSPSDDPLLAKQPTLYRVTRASPTSMVLRAWCSTRAADANAFYWVFASNIVVSTYDRAEMAAGLYTNDAAGVISRADSLPGADGADVVSDPRRLVNAGSLSAYVASRKTEIADEAWNRTPGGRDVPDRRLVTIDEPLVQQGAIAYLQSGDYWCQSYVGGDWQSVSTGSVWRIGPSGTVAFEIASTNRMLYIQAFSVSGGYATLDIATNWVSAPPQIQFSTSLVNPQWLTCPQQSMSDEGGYWRGVCPGVAESRFFRAVSPGGDQRVRSHYRHEMLGGLSDGAHALDSVIVSVVTNHASGATVRLRLFGEILP
jgi:hypothetical protein